MVSASMPHIVHDSVRLSNIHFFTAALPYLSLSRRYVHLEFRVSKYRQSLSTHLEIALPKIQRLSCFFVTYPPLSFSLYIAPPSACSPRPVCHLKPPGPACRVSREAICGTKGKATQPAPVPDNQRGGPQVSFVCCIAHSAVALLGSLRPGGYKGWPWPCSVRAAKPLVPPVFLFQSSYRHLFLFRFQLLDCFIPGDPLLEELD